MATRYNAFGWYNPYSPAVQNTPGITGVGQVYGASCRQQPLRGLLVPMAGMPLAVEPGQNKVIVEVRNEEKVMANPPPAGSTPTTVTTANGGSPNLGSPNGGSTSQDQLTSMEKSKFRQLGVALCILSAFTLGLAVSYFAVKTDGSCLLQQNQQNSSNETLNQFYYWSIRTVALPLPVFCFAIGILCTVVRERGGGQIRSIFGITIFTFLMPYPLMLASGIGGIISAQNCTTSIQIIYIVIPAFLLTMALIIFGLLIYLLVLLGNFRYANVSIHAQTTIPTSTTTTTVTTAATTQPAPPPPAILIPPPTPTIPQIPQPSYVIQMPKQQNYGMPAYPRYPQYPYGPPRLPPPRPPPMFGASPYRRLPASSPYGYSPFRMPQMYRPSPYY